MNITPTPWSVSDNPLESPNNDTAATIWKDNKEGGCALIADISCSPGYEQGKANAQAIVTAVNCTYGNGIDPNKIKELVYALDKISNWALPETGKFWDKEETQPMSYEAAWGTNGSRDYFKKMAQDALNAAKLK